MKQERMKVLEMLETGKISADEAARLLEAMKAAGRDGFQGFSIDEEKLQRFTKGVDNFTREFGSRVESIYKEVEPKVKKASQAVLEKTAAVFDEISKSLNESLENARKAAAEEPQEDDEPKEN